MTLSLPAPIVIINSIGGGCCLIFMGLWLDANLDKMWRMVKLLETGPPAHWAHSTEATFFRQHFLSNILCFLSLRQLQNIQKCFAPPLKLMKVSQYTAEAKTNSHISGFVGNTDSMGGGSCVWPVTELQCYSVTVLQCHSDRVFTVLHCNLQCSAVVWIKIWKVTSSTSHGIGMLILKKWELGAGGCQLLWGEEDKSDFTNETLS